MPPATNPRTLRFDAIVLAGGGARRMGGVDKAAQFVGPGQSLLDFALEAVRGACQVIVVGGPRELPDDVIGVSEQPPGSGPAAAVETGLMYVDSPCTVVLACDMPLIDARAVARLVAALVPDDVESYGGDSEAADQVALGGMDRGGTDLGEIDRTRTDRGGTDRGEGIDRIRIRTGRDEKDLGEADPHVADREGPEPGEEHPETHTRSAAERGGTEPAGGDPDPVDGALYVDADGRRQPLAAAYRTDALRAAARLLPTTRDAAMWELIKPLTFTEVAAHPGLTLDCDTWDDLAQVRAILDDRREPSTDEGGMT